MKILILGGYGFIGSHITINLINSGHDVTIAGRNKKYSLQKFPDIAFVELDFAQKIELNNITNLLNNFDLVINCIGILQSSKKIFDNIHAVNPETIYHACEKTKTKLIHISALGIDNNFDTEYAKSKKKAELLINNYNFDWIVLKPSLVYSTTSSYGGTSLLRGFAGLPYIPVINKGEQKFQPICISDLISSINNIINNNLYSRKFLELAGPEQLSLKQIISKLRKWLGYKPAKFISVPVSVCKIICKIGDNLQLAPINSTSLNMVISGNTSQYNHITTELHIKPQSMDMQLNKTPSSVQDRWHAKLYFYAVFLKLLLAIFWIASGIIPYFNQADTLELLANSMYNSIFTLSSSSNLKIKLIYGLFYFSTAWDILLGIVLLLSKKLKLILTLQACTIIFYTIFITLTLPNLWLEPFGSILKNLPILALIFNLYLLSDDR